ncbi:MAG: type III-A CRISPR-associated RAMP protein Csm3 [bacterium]
MERFIGKLFINAVIEIETGLHIGGAKESVEIGGLDNPVIKTVNGIPYIPGSSIKGKMRCVLERVEGIRESKKPGDPCGCGNCSICLLFGSATSDDSKKTLTRLCVRDAFLNIKDFEERFSELYKKEIYTEEKTENVIDRITGTAKHPRTMERIPAGTKFITEMVLNFYENDKVDSLIETFIQGLRLVEDEYLGGSGTRGYGKIGFKNLSFSLKKREDYIGENIKEPLLRTEVSTFDVKELINKVRNSLKVEQK